MRPRHNREKDCQHNKTEPKNGSHIVKHPTAKSTRTTNNYGKQSAPQEYLSTDVYKVSVLDRF